MKFSLVARLCVFFLIYSLHLPSKTMCTQYLDVEDQRSKFGMLNSILSMLLRARWPSRRKSVQSCTGYIVAVSTPIEARDE